MNKEYKPISCDLHDELEARSTLRRPCHIEYHDESGRKMDAVDVIVDVFTKDHEEFVRLGGGDLIRLDQIVGLDGKYLRQDEPIEA